MAHQVTISRTWQTRRLLARAWQALSGLDVPETERLAAQVEHMQMSTSESVGTPDYTTTLLRAALLAVKDDPTAALALAQRVQQPHADLQCRALAAMICRWAHWRAGALDEFHSVSRAQWRVGSRHCRALTAVFDLNLEAAVEFGRLRLAVSRALAAEASEHARRTACGNSAAGLLAAALLGQVAYEQGHLDEADLAIRYHMRRIRTGATVECVTCAYIVMARLAFQRQRSDDALALLRDAQALGERRRWPRQIAAMLGERIRILLENNDIAGTVSALRELEILMRSQPTTSASARADMEAQWQLAQLRFRQRQVTAAQTATAVESLRQQALARCDLRLALEAHLISVAAYARCGEISEASERLIDALDIGAANGMCMTFVDAGLPIRELLEKLCHDPSVSDERILELRPYMHTLLARCPNSQPPASSTPRPSQTIRQPLTLRESNVLRLIAGGLSNKRIARHLDIAPETVKSHTKKIFAKLAAQTRAQAVAHGEVLGIIRGNTHGLQSAQGTS